MRSKFAIYVLAGLLGTPLAAVHFVPPVLAQEVTGASTSEDSRIGYFASPTEEYGFVLDRSGEKALLRFELTREIHVLDMVPGPQGVTYLKNSSGKTLLRLMPWGGATVYDDEGAEGGAYGQVRKARPLQQRQRRKAHVMRRADEIASELDGLFKIAVAIQFDPALAGRPDAAGAAGDALELVGLAMKRLARDDLAREIMADRISRVTFKVAPAPGVNLDGKTLVIAYTPALGLEGRPSSADVEAFLLENL